MEFVDGETLSSRLKREGKLPLHEALEIVVQIARALQYAHQRSIIHRDIKPANILLAGDGRPKLADLGLAKSTEEDTSITQSGTGLGTPSYMAPEQAANARNIDHRADIYALGITLLQLVTGRLPYRGRSAYSVVLAHATDALPTARQLGAEIPAEVESIIRKMAAKDPDQRYQDYESLLEGLGQAAASLTGVRDHTPKLAPRRPDTPVNEQPTQPATAGAGVPRREAPTLAVLRRIAVALALLLAGVLLYAAYTRYLAAPPSASPDGGGQDRDSDPSTPVHAVIPFAPGTQPKPWEPPQEAGGRAPERVGQDGPAGEPAAAPQPGPEGNRAAQLPPALAADFEIPAQSQDQYGNPVRNEFDEGTELPLEIRHKATGIHLVFIPPGEFLMGSPEHERGRNGNEGPLHRVRTAKPLYLGKYEVTQKDWQTVMVRTASVPGGLALPLRSRSWDEVQEFIRSLNEAMRGPGGAVFSLPSEAQWEYACRSGAQSPFSFGEDESLLPEFAWYADNAGALFHPVGQKRPNSWGLYDMHGNACELCLDWLGEYREAAETDPVGENAPDLVAWRGGSVYASHGWATQRAARRVSIPKSLVDKFVGFRIALNLHADE